MGGHGQMKVFRGKKDTQSNSAAVVLEATATCSSPFRQPGMTSEDSDALVFGLGFSSGIAE